MPVGKRLAAAALLAAVLPLSACAPAPGGGGEREARVVVRVAPTADPRGYEVHLAGARADFRTAFRVERGETRTVAVPEGWVTVRVAGLCVVPTAATGTTTVEVAADDCRVA
ncbi:hypothetical protein [Amnibacterium setariae]|uniref:Uncharacterized protein n=1 Tax=Amnibacterium setariae TaxID=2306585 RepID=A0A3A1TUL2_9MICO|nr:hypothetical protein [Amnibacterium setariae]RIX27912.1 hypothetical protein D1781_10320 [Amnibacterium setariae]